MKVKSNKIADVIEHYSLMLNSKYDKQNSANLIRELISYFIEIPKLEISLNLDKRISESELLKIHFGIKDLLKNRPLQYIFGEATFLDYLLQVDENVLIPRPETEELVGLILKSRDLNSLKILDIGTGSGAIAIGLSKNTGAEVFAIDISKQALEIAKKNARNINVNITFILTDILDNKNWKNIQNNLDIIVSNPPYIRNSEKELMHKNVLDYEPELALFVDDSNPFVFYKNISELAINKLKDDGELWFEINEFLADELKTHMKSYFHSIEIIKDFRGKNRFCRLKEKIRNNS